jgi:hypothetical protein
MMRAIMRRIAVKALRQMGFSSYMAPKVFDEFIEDLMRNKESSLKQKIWAYRRGFYSERISRYSLTEHNYKHYFPDISYLKLHPVNGEFGKWIDDKLTLRYIFSAYSEYLPEYYFTIDKGSISQLPDYAHSDGNKPSFRHVLELVEMKENLALKPYTGEGGSGFHQLSARDCNYFIDGQIVSKEDVTSFLGTLNKYIVTEYIRSHHEIRKIYDITPNTLRILTIYDKKTGPKIIGAVFRFGVNSSGMVDNLIAGGIMCGVEIEHGEMFNPKMFVNGKAVDISAHPDTGVSLGGRLPHWERVLQKILEISNAYPQLIYMGWDIIITENGFKIIEINSHPEIRYMQIYYPLRSNERQDNLSLKNSFPEQVKSLYPPPIPESADRTQVSS